MVFMYLSFVYLLVSFVDVLCSLQFLVVRSFWPFAGGI